MSQTQGSYHSAYITTKEHQDDVYIGSRFCNSVTITFIDVSVLYRFMCIVVVVQQDRPRKG